MSLAPRFVRSFCTALLVISIPVLSIGQSLESRSANGSAAGPASSRGGVHGSTLQGPASSPGGFQAPSPPPVAPPQPRGVWYPHLQYDCGAHPSVVLSGLVDGDGFEDLVVGSAHGIEVFRGLGNGEFAPPLLHSGSCSDFVLVDFNNDGKLDVAGTPTVGNRIWYRTGVGDGTFGPLNEHVVGDKRSVVAGDWNGDSNIDIGFISNFGLSFRILWGSNGGSPVLSAAAIAIGGGRGGSADVDGDGDEDLVFAWTGGIIVHANDGTGIFAPGIVYSTTTPVLPIRAALGDIDSDGDVDVVISEISVATSTDSCGIFLNDGSGDLSTYFNMLLEESDPFDVALGDVDGDMDLDILLSHDAVGAGQTGVTLIENEGALFSPRHLPMIDDDGSVTFCDVDNDADLDLVRCNDGLYSISIITNDGTGHFDFGFLAAEHPFFAGLALAIGDLDGDGNEDVVKAGTQRLEPFLNDGFGNLIPTAEVPALLNGIALADMDGDGDLDVVGAGNEVHVFLNDGFGTMGMPANYPVGTGPRGLVLADLDGDSDVDVAVPVQWDLALAVLYNDGSGALSSATHFPLAGRPEAIAVADFDGDGDPDLVGVAGNTDEMYVIFNNGAGVFSAASTFGPIDNPAAVTAADTDGDGDMDIITCGATVTTVHENNGSGGFASSTNYVSTGGENWVVTHDIDQDGALDIVVSSVGNQNANIFFNDGLGGFSDRQQYGTGAAPSTVLVADLNSDGNPDLVALTSRIVRIMFGRVAP